MNDTERTKRSAVKPHRIFWSDSFSMEEFGPKAGWYYEAREGMQGPFRTRQDALAHMETLLDRPVSPPRRKWS